MLFAPAPIEGLPDDVCVSCVPGRFLNQVQQHPAHVAVDDARAGANIVEFLGSSNASGHDTRFPVARDPLIDGVAISHQEVGVSDV